MKIPKEVYEVKGEEPVVKEQAIPDFVPATEDVSPLKTRMIDVVARNTPLSDVLRVIADATGLNLAMEKGVVTETPVSMTLRNVSAEDALSSIFSSVDYFYTIKNNMLVVKAVETKTYEIGNPSVIQTYSVDVGGDILGSALAASSSSGGSGSSGASGSTGASGSSGGSSSLKGSITQNAKNDPTAFGFWAAIEKSLASILGQAAAASNVAAPVPVQGQPQPQGTAEPMQSFTVNRMTGTIIVTASKRNLERIEQYINAIKRVINRQVLVEAKIIEVQLTDGMQFGIDWSQALNQWKGVFKAPTTIGTSGFASVVPAGSAVFSASIAGNFTALMNILQQQGEVRTLSNPRVNIMNGQTALLSVGRSVTFISNVNTTTTVAAGSAPITTFTVGTSSVLSGMIIGIVPFINEDGEISMTITPIVSNLVQLQNTSVGPSGNQTQITLPTIDLRELSTTVKVRDGQMVIIGGLISKTENVQDNKVPGIADAPIIGTLFTSHNKSESRSELVVVLQPVIVSK
ncbi:MAG: pilus (MSHA type) biogenesis protein MshL [Nitrospirae bacterium]|nr:pilus (MSHA type) biogenesis protein MshL [Nitrospirota bacterium]